MKKILIILAIFCICGALASGPAFGATLKGMKYGIFNVLGVKGDHTYHCGYSSGYKCWSWTGGEANGSYIPYTSGSGDYGDSKCTSAELGCRFVYAVQGVCHQEANRGLYTAGKTIASGGVQGYWFTGPYFGTYGGGWTICKTECWLYW